MMEKTKLQSTRWRRWIYSILIGFIVIGGLVLLDRNIRFNKLSKQSAQIDGESKVLPADLEIKNFKTGKNETFGDYKGKALIVNFWATWCEACMAEMPSIQKLYKDLKPEGLEVIAINVEDNPERMVPKIVDRLGLTFPIFLDENGSLSEKFEVVAIPFTIITNRKHEIIWAESGEKDWYSKSVVDEVRKILKQQ